MYSIFCALALFFVIFVVPETKGRDLEDISRLFTKTKRQSIASAPVVEKNASIPTISGLVNEGFKQSTTNVSNGINGHHGNDSDITKL